MSNYVHKSSKLIDIDTQTLRYISGELWKCAKHVDEALQKEHINKGDELNGRKFRIAIYLSSWLHKFEERTHEIAREYEDNSYNYE